MRLDGKVAIITGAGRGIGRSMAKAYAAEGAKVVLFARTPSDLKEAAAEIESKKKGVTLVQRGDVSKGPDVAKAVNETLKRFGRIDILLNNAGIGGPEKKFYEMTESEWDSIMATNVRGPFLFSKAVLPHMLKQKSGNIINVSSGAGQKRPRKYIRSVAYAVSKFAVEGLTHALAVSLLGTGVNVNSFNPTPTKTSIQDSWTPEMFKEHAQELGELQEPEAVNELAIYLAALKPGEVTGESFNAREWNKTHGGA
jgi:3-oxoacyl-[acyl-carrier protein] reductase